MIQAKDPHQIPLPQAARALRELALWHATALLTGLSQFWEMRAELSEGVWDEDVQEMQRYDIRKQAEAFLVRDEAWIRFCDSLALEHSGWLLDLPCGDHLSYAYGDMVKHILPTEEWERFPSRSEVLAALGEPEQEISKLQEEYRERLKARLR